MLALIGRIGRRRARRPSSSARRPARRSWCSASVRSAGPV